ncbi:MAG: DUF5606 family protein [Candidatus Cyclobacteriaceae bacterium M3_2C_046]
MDLKEIASISGKGGLFKIVKPTRSGVIVETLDDKKHKMAVSASNRISVLEEISVYTTTTDGSVPLKEVFQKIKSEFEDDPGVTSSSSPDELKAFLEYIIPDYDREKVYISDIKKIVSWYNQLMKHYPEIFEQEEEKKEDASSDETTHKSSDPDQGSQTDQPELGDKS